MHHNASVNVLFTTEVTPHINFRGADGFVGLVGYDANALIRLPLLPYAALIEKGTKLPFEPRTRTTIGIWVHNCHCITRNRIIDTLLSSGLPVRSYGECRRNQNASWDDYSLDTPEAKAECGTHRLMLAVENEACSGWVSYNMMHAVLGCGSIPIVHSVGGLPEYDALLGALPRIDASQRGWLTRVRLIMAKEGYYQRFLRDAELSGRARARTTGAAVGLSSSAAAAAARHDAARREETITAPAHGDSQSAAELYHCAWYRAQLFRRPPTRVEFGRCAYCEGEYDECQEADRDAKGRCLPDRAGVVVPCNTTREWAEASLSGGSRGFDD